MTPELQKTINDALLVLIPVFTGWVVARLRKSKKDSDAAFKKIRAHEEHLGIETRVEGGKLYVICRKNDPSPHTSGPLPQETSASGATPSG